MLAIRMTRHGAKKRPFFHIVVADSRSPRDGRFIEKLGTYNPLLPREHAERIKLDKERIAHWLKVGAQPSDRVAKFFAQAELMKPRERREQTKKNQPRAKAQERMKAAATAAEAGEKAAGVIQVDGDTIKVHYLLYLAPVSIVFAVASGTALVRHGGRRRALLLGWVALYAVSWALTVATAF